MLENETHVQESMSHMCKLVFLCLCMSFDGGVGDMGQERLNILVSITHEVAARGVTCFFCQSEKVTLKHNVW